MQGETKKGWRYRIGMALFIIPFPLFFATPIVVPMMGLSATETTALIGGILLVIEVVWFASIPLLGKEGFDALKSKAFGWMKLTPGPISRGRHRFGIALLIVSVLGSVLLSGGFLLGSFAMSDSDDPTGPILGMTFQQQASLYTWVEIASIVGMIVSVLILGGEFWERLKNVFDWPGGAEA